MHPLVTFELVQSSRGLSVSNAAQQWESKYVIKLVWHHPAVNVTNKHQPVGSHISIVVASFAVLA